MAENTITRPTAPQTEQVLKDLGAVWRAFPNKGLFFCLLAAWVALFETVGNATFGYVRTPSLFRWLYVIYTAPGSEDAHGLLLPLVVLGLCWWKRRALMDAEKRLWPPGLVLLGLAVAAHVLCYVVQQPRLSVLAFLGGLYALLATVWGRRFAAVAFFPFFLLVFCVPQGTALEPLTIPLRRVSTEVAVAVIRHGLGIPVICEGVVILDPKGHYAYEVAAPCSGIHSFVAMFALTTIYGFVTFQTAWRRAVLVGLALPLALAGNVLRLICIVFAAEGFGSHAGEFVHEWFGFATFLLALMVMLAVGTWLREPAGATAPAAAAESA